ncbi:MAG: ATP-binding protein [Saprospiraceae bacterium]|jgi:hypothetical protein|nr:ATP-binding protein [Saprospiraceae bacterium]MBP6566553.1 ATP-binding protein [Saprospiraceae bacterium]
MNIDWKKEIDQRLNQSQIYKILDRKLSIIGEPLASQQRKLIYDAVEYAYQKSKLIIKYMPEYTLHDGDHLFRVLYLMEKIITTERIKYLANAELTLLILTAFFHDIGMAPFEKEIRAWKQDWDEEEPTTQEELEYGKFMRFANTFPEKLEEILKYDSLGQTAKAQVIYSYLISEFIRNTHAKRTREIISKEWEGKVLYKDQDLTTIFAELCFSHNEDALKLLSLETDFLCDDSDTINIPFIGVVLRLADLLDFDGKRTPSVLFSHLSVRNPVSLNEWEKHRSVKAWSISENQIVFSAVCKHPAIEASIRKFCDYIDDELKNCNLILSRIANETKYKLKLPTHVSRSKIVAEKDISTGEPKYLYRDTSFHLSKNQVIDLLMGTKLYGDPEVALRELLQNSIDACLLSQALHKKWNIPYDPLITVKYYSIHDEDFLEVIDNGIGMNQEIIDKYYTRIGSSFYRSRDFFDLQANSNLNFKPISRFGIGILSSFMVADSIEVETKRLKDKYEYDTPLKLIIEGYDSIFTILRSDKQEPGTATKLYLKASKNPWRDLSNEAFIDIVKNAVTKPEIPINIITDKISTPYRQQDFYDLKADSLKDYSWNNDENIKEVLIEFNEDGIEGNAIIGILEKHNEPVKKIEKLSKNIEIDGMDFELSMAIRYDVNRITKDSTNIDVTDDGQIGSNSSTSYIASSKGKFAIHGISYSGELFPNYLTREKKTMLRWPLPMLIILNVGGTNDLDLNSARNEIIYNDKWNIFEQKLSQVICTQLKKLLDEPYWNKLSRILKQTKTENFKIGLNNTI